jgi:uncharacterized protein (DUF885 family)
MKSTLLFLLGTLLWIGCNSPKESDLASIIEAYNDYREMGGEDSRYDLSDSLVNARMEALSVIQSDLLKTDAQNLSEEELINYDMLKLIVDDDLFNMNYGSFLMPLNAEGGFITGLIYSTQSARLNNDEAIDKYAKSMEGISGYIEGQIERMNQGIEEKKVLPEVVVNNCVSLLQDQLSGDPESLFLFVPLEKVDPVNKDRIGTIIKDSAIPAMHKLKNYLLTEYLPNARPEVGVSGIAQGKEYYEQRVKYFTTLDMTPEEVFQKGQSEVARIRGEMQEIIDALGFKGTYADFLEFLRTDPQFYAKTPQELLNHAAWLSKKAEEILPRYFGKLPRLPFTVNPVPEAIAPTYTTGRYSPGSYKDHRAGQYWVNTYKLESRPLYVLPSLTLHEAVPGHHLQGSLAEEVEDVPSFRRNTYLSAYGEGWGLYSEYLGKEAGMYTTPYEDFGRLTYEMWRACRLVVDPGMHYKGWTRQQAIDYMASNTALSIHEVTTEIDRYIGWPGQAVSYKIGELKIRELRQRAEQELGDNFDIRKFHDKVLENGSVPLKTLEAIINAHIKDSKELEG